jgi:WD40 repeat protein
MVVAQVHAAPSDAEDEADLQSVIRDTQQAAKRMHPLLGSAITVACAGQDAQTDLNAIDDFQDTYLKPLRIFDPVIAEIGNVWIILLKRNRANSVPQLHPYAKMALDKIFSTIARDLTDRDPEMRRALAGAVADEISPKKTVQAVLRGHTSSVNSFSLDGTRIVTGSHDKTVRLWDAGTGEPVVEPLRGHTDSVNSVSFSPDGTRIVTGSWDKTGWLMTLNTSNNHSISFSSNPIHALRNAFELMEPASHDNHSSIPFVLNDIGWVVGPKHQLLFGVPSSASRFPFYNSATILVMPRGGPELELSRVAHGQHRQSCREQ